MTDDQLTQRLHQLERQQRRIREGLTGAVLVGLLLMGLGAVDPKPKILEAGGFRVIDEKGNVSAVLWHVNGGELILFDEKENRRVDLTGSGDGGVMRLSGSSDKTAISFTTDGANSFSSFIDAKGHTLIHLGIQDSEPSVDVNDKDGHDGCSLFTHGGSILSLRSDSSKGTLFVTVPTVGGPSATFMGGGEMVNLWAKATH